MTYEQIDKIIKPYWIEKFNDCVLDERYIDSSINIWYGLYNQNGELVIGTLKNSPTCYINAWYYDGKFFTNHNTFFDLTITNFNQAMKRYLIKTYTLKIKSLL